MIYPAVDQLILLNRTLLQPGEVWGLRDRALLECGQGAPMQTFGGEELHPTLFRKAAALARSIVQNHPFENGNKRTGIAAASVFLGTNGYTVEATDAVLKSSISFEPSSGLRNKGDQA